MEYLIVIVLLGAVFAALAYPFYRPRGREVFVWQGAETVAELLAQRDGLYATLRDLQQDFEQGKLSAPDYEALRARYMARAVAALQKLDAIQAQASHSDDQVSQSIEREVAAMRQSRSRRAAARLPVPAAAVADRVPAGREGEMRFCSQCGRPAEPDDKFCGRCGAPLHS